MICSVCQSAFVDGIEEGPHHVTIDSFRAATKERCLICSVIMGNALKDGVDLFKVDNFQKPFSTFCFQAGPPNRMLRIEIGMEPPREWPNHIQSTFYLVSLEDDNSLQSSDADADMFRRKAIEMSDGGFAQRTPDHTGAEAVCNIASEWLHQCLNSHTRCELDRNKDWQPARLIDVAGTELRIVRREETVGKAYVTLSHCWGPNPTFLTLTADNMKRLLKGFSISELPANFHDAVSMTRRLGFRYIWIDSLCILQSGPGSLEDWQLHAVAMRDVYKNGIVNLSADRSADASGGLFTSRNPQLIQPCIVRKKVFDSEHYCVVDARMFDSGIYSSALAKRAWVLQERLLSPRAIHFGVQQIYWECAERPKLCESYPGGVPCYWPEYDAALFSIPEAALIRKNFGQPLHVYRSYWTSVLKTYTRCALTRPDEDKLVALAGIAQRMGPFLEDDSYVAGLFHYQLPDGLLWEVDHPKKLDRDERKYRAPSWSWAAIDGPVDFPSYGNSSSSDSPTGFKHVHVSLRNPHNPFGQLLSAELELEGPTASLSWTHDNGRLVSFTIGDVVLPPRSGWLRSCAFDTESNILRDQEGCLALVILLHKTLAHCLLLEPAFLGGKKKYTRLGVAHADFPSAVDLITKEKTSLVLI